MRARTLARDASERHRTREPPKSSGAQHPEQVKLAPLDAIPRDALHMLSCEALHKHVQDHRKVVLERLRYLLPVAIEIGDGRTPDEIRDAIVAVTGWWS